VKMRCTSPVSLTSSTSTKDAVWGCSVGGRVSQTRGVTLRAPNSTVLLMGISRREMRPVTLSRAAKTAIGFLTISAPAGPGAKPKARAKESKERGSQEAGRRVIPMLARSAMPHTS
jgi:hypothetical protein